METIREIAQKTLAARGYHGLFSHNAECSCDIEDLMKEEYCDGHCVPGFFGPDPTGEYDYRMYPSRADVAKAKAEYQEEFGEPYDSKFADCSCCEKPLVSEDLQYCYTCHKPACRDCSVGYVCDKCRAEAAGKDGE